MNRFASIVSSMAFAGLCCAPAFAIVQAPHDEAHGVSCADCHVAYAGVNDPAAAKGAAAAGSTAQSVSDPSKSWVDGDWVDGVLTIQSGANLGQFRTIVANGAHVVSWDAPLPAPLAIGDQYQIGKATQRTIETRCKSCHNPTGPASATSEVGLHIVGDGTIIGCGKCHEPHNILPNSGPTQALIRQAIRWPSAQPTTVYPSGGASAFVRPATHDGVCETCHTQTDYHRNNATGDHSHNADKACTDCHGHKSGFLAQCTSCHAVPQDNGDGVPAGGRRAMMGEFPASTAHAHFGANIGSSCTVCHSQTTHKDGYVDLVDPDDGSVLFTFKKWTDLGSDPDVSTFCMHCHDADGAKRLSTPFDPFGNGNAPPDVASRFKGTLQWQEYYGDDCFGNEGTLRQVNSHHDIGSGDQALSGAKVECLNCHGAHNPSKEKPLADPNATTSSWTGTTNDFCIVCHAGGSGPTAPAMPAGVTPPSVPLRAMASCGYNAAPWWVEFTYGNSAHGGASKRGWTGYSGAPSYNMECTSCHDAHGSYTAANPTGNPYMIRDGVDGTAMVDDGAKTLGFNGPPWTTFGVSRAVTVGISGLNVGWGGGQGLCSACHASYQAAYDWHDYCTACQSCHGHGQSWGEYDFGGGNHSAPCK